MEVAAYVVRVWGNKARLSGGDGGKRGWKVLERGCYIEVFLVLRVAV